MSDRMSGKDVLDRVNLMEIFPEDSDERRFFLTGLKLLSRVATAAYVDAQGPDMTLGDLAVCLRKIKQAIRAVEHVNEESFVRACMEGRVRPHDILEDVPEELIEDVLRWGRERGNIKEERN